LSEGDQAIKEAQRILAEGNKSLSERVTAAKAFRETAGSPPLERAIAHKRNFCWPTKLMLETDGGG
jgi:hypothetical protein